MKKIEYQAPKMEIIKMKYQQALLDGSTPKNPVAPGTDDQEEW